MVFKPLCSELKRKKTFLKTGEIGSGATETRELDIRSMRNGEVWKRLDETSSRPQIPKNLRETIERFYSDYEEFLNSLLDFIERWQREARERFQESLPTSDLKRLVDHIMKSIFWGTENSARSIVEDAFSEIGVSPNGEQLRWWSDFVKNKIAFEQINEQKKKLYSTSPEAGFFQSKPKYKALKEQMKKLAAEVEISIKKIEEIIGEERISDLEDSEIISEPDFYHR